MPRPQALPRDLSGLRTPASRIIGFNHQLKRAAGSRSSGATSVQVDADHHVIDGGLILVPVKGLRFAPTTPAAWLPPLTGSSTEPDVGSYVMVRAPMGRLFPHTNRM